MKNRDLHLWQEFSDIKNGGRSMKVRMLFETGYEEVEALTVVDLLRRARLTALWWQQTIRIRLQVHMESQ